MGYSDVLVNIRRYLLIALWISFTGCRTGEISSTPTVQPVMTPIVTPSLYPSPNLSTSPPPIESATTTPQTLFTSLVSITIDEGPPDFSVGFPAVSGNGERIVFLSRATNFVQGVSTNFDQVYLSDMTQDKVTLISVNSAGEPADGWNLAPSISADGNTIAFFSNASNLASDAKEECPAETHECASLYVYSVSTGTLERFSAGALFASTLSTSLSEDGRYVAFSTPVASIREGVYLVDRQTGNIQTIMASDPSVDYTPGISSGGALVDISSNGQYVVFASDRGDLVNGDNNQTYDVFLYDVQTAQLERITNAADGSSGMQYVPATGGAIEGGLSISADGRYIVFTSAASLPVDQELSPCEHWWDETFPHCRHVYLYDRETAGFELVSTANGMPGDRASFGGDISADGRFVVFISFAQNLTDLPLAECRDFGGGYCHQVYVRDRQEQRTFIVTQGWQREPADARSYDAVIAADGNFIVYVSGASTLIPGLLFEPNGYILRTNIEDMINSFKR